MYLYNESRHVKLDSGRNNTEQRQEDTTMKADVTKVLLELQQTDEKEEFYRYDDNPENSVMRGTILGMDDKEEYYRYHNNPGNLVTSGSIAGMDEKEEYYRYHDNPKTEFTMGRFIVGMDEKEKLISLISFALNFLSWTLYYSS